MVTIKERPKSKNKFENHLKWLVISNGKTVGEHAFKETSEKHKTKILNN